MPRKAILETLFISRLPSPDSLWSVRLFLILFVPHWVSLLLLLIPPFLCRGMEGREG